MAFQGWRTLALSPCDLSNREMLIQPLWAFFLVYLFLKIYLFIYLWLYWVLLLHVGSLYLHGVRATLGRGAQASCCSGFSCRGARALGALSSAVAACGPWSVGTVGVVHGLGCSLACGIFPGQGSNPCPLCWEVGSYPLSHKGSPIFIFVDAWHCLRHN